MLALQQPINGGISMIAYYKLDSLLESKGLKKIDLQKNSELVHQQWLISAKTNM